MALENWVGAEAGREPDDDVAAIQSEWLRRVEAEYRSAAITHQLILWLLQLAAPIELVRAGLRIVEDELEHSELSHDAYRAAGGSQVLNFGREPLGLPQPPPDRLLEAVVRVTVETFCLGETVAVRLFAKLRDPSTQPAARSALDRILKDEVRHRDFGWTLLEYLLSTAQGPDIRALTNQNLPAAFARLRQNYAYHALGQGEPASPARLAWGLMAPADYAEVLDETLDRDYVPLFAELGIDARKAWGDASPKSGRPAAVEAFE